MFDYPIDKNEIEYQIKWTILKHAQYMINNLGLELLGMYASAGEYMPNDNVYDVISNEYNSVPAIACDYSGTVQDPTVQGLYIDVYELRFRGRVTQITPQSRFGVKSENRNLLLIHSAIRDNFKLLSEKGQGLEIYSFDDEGQEPVKTGHHFHMVLIESSFAETNDASRANGINWVFRVTLDI